MSAQCPPNVRSMSSQCLLNGRSMSASCLLNVHSMCAQCAPIVTVSFYYSSTYVWNYVDHRPPPCAVIFRMVFHRYSGSCLCTDLKEVVSIDFYGCLPSEEKKTRFKNELACRRLISPPALLWRRFRIQKKTNSRFFRNGPGVNVTIAIFGDFRQFSATKLAYFLKKNRFLRIFLPK
jgi:hypothetical protein